MEAELRRTREIADKIAGRYKSRWLKGYVRSKLRSDCLYSRFLSLTRGRSRPLLDVGCGIGLLGLYLRESGEDRRVIGCDFDRKKIAAARGAARGLDGLEFFVEDARSRSDFRGDIALLDVLQYLPSEDQQVLLAALAGNVDAGGMIIIRTTIRDSSWRFKLSWLMERIAGGIRWMRRDVLEFPTEEHVLRIFQPPVWSAEVMPLWGANLFNTYLFVIRKLR